MALLFTDSFGGYATADLSTRYAGGSLGCTISNANLPPNPQAGAQSLNSVGGFNNYNLSSNLGGQARLIAGFRFFRPVGNQGFVCQFGTASGPFNNLVAGLFLASTGTFIYDGSNTIIGTGPTVPSNEWHHWEFDVTFGAAANATLNVYLDGNPTPFIHLTGITLTSATASFVGIPGLLYNGAPFPGSTCVGVFADYYYFNGAAQTFGPYNFALPLAPQGFGAAKMAFAVPTGPGTVSAWTANGAATIWQSINQMPQDGDTTYASDATPGDQYQCVFGALPAMQSLIAVQLSTYARTDDAGPRAYQSGFWKGGTFGYSGVNQFLGGTYNYIEDEFAANPVTSAAWLPADLTGLQFGCKLTV